MNQILGSLQVDAKNSGKVTLNYLDVGNEVELIELGDFISTENRDNLRYYFLEAYEQARFLETLVELPALQLKEIQVKGDEYVLLENISADDFDLLGCSFHDAIKERKSWQEPEIIPAKSLYKIEGALSLNDSSPDQAKLFCFEGKETIFDLSYAAVDDSGKAIWD